MNTRASRAVPIYIFSASSFFRAKWHKFCFLCAPFKPRRREKCFDLGTNRHRNKSLVRTVQTFPLATLQRVFLARVPFIVLYILSLPSPFCQFCSPLIFRPFSAPPLLRAAPRSAFAPFSLFDPFDPFDRFAFKRKKRAIRARTALQNCHLRFANRTEKPPQSPSKAEKRRFSQIF